MSDQLSGSEANHIAGLRNIIWACLKGAAVFLTIEQAREYFSDASATLVTGIFEPRSMMHDPWMHDLTCFPCRHQLSWWPD